MLINRLRLQLVTQMLFEKLLNTYWKKTDKKSTLKILLGNKYKQTHTHGKRVKVNTFHHHHLCLQIPLCTKNFPCVAFNEHYTLYLWFPHPFFSRPKTDFKQFCQRNYQLNSKNSYIYIYILFFWIINFTVLLSSISKYRKLFIWDI